MRSTLVVLSLAVATAPLAGAAIQSAASLLQEEKKAVVIGINVGEVGEALAAQIGVDAGRSILVADVTPELPAAKAGLKRFDVITAVDGQPIGSRDGLRNALSQKSPGDPITVTVVRGGKSLDFTMNVVESQSPRFATLLERLAGGANDAEAKQLVELALLRDHAAAGEDAAKAADVAKKFALLAREKAAQGQLLEGQVDQQMAEQIRQAQGQAFEAERRAYEAAVAQSMSRVDQAKRELETARAAAESEITRSLLEAHQNRSLDDAQRAAIEKSVGAAMERVKKSLSNAERRLAWPQVQLRAGQNGEWRALVEHAEQQAHEQAQQASAAGDEAAAESSAARGVWRRGGSDLSGVEQRLAAIEERLARIEKLLQQRHGPRFD